MRNLFGLLTISLFAITVSFAQQGDGYALDSWESAKAPTKAATAPATPVKQETEASPAKEAPVEAPAAETPAAPAKSTSAKKAPAKAAPAKPAPVKAESAKVAAPTGTPAVADSSAKLVAASADSTPVVSADSSATPIVEPAADSTAKPVAAPVAPADTASALAPVVADSVAAPAATPAVDSSAAAVPPAVPAVDTTATPAVVPAAIPAPVDSAVVPTVAQKDSVQADSAQQKAVRRFDDTPENIRKSRGKKTFAEYENKKKAELDSSLLATCRYGFSLSGGRLYDKHLGKVAYDQVWGTNLGFYYFYRRYFNPYIGFQGRLGMLYRYSRFDDDYDNGSVQFNGQTFKKNLEKSSKSYNFAFDAPISVRTGGFINRTMFLYASLTLGVTKSFYERIRVSNEVTVENPTEELENALSRMDNYPYESSYKVHGAFDVDDWETNSWIGFGFDLKYLAVEFQALIAANSTKDNHRFQDLFHKSFPTWRVMIDFGAY